MKCPNCHQESHEEFCPWCGQDSSRPVRPLAMKSPNTRVYVVQNQLKEGNAKFDLTPAEQYGSFVFCLSADAKPFNAAACIKELHLKLRNIRKQDHLLLLGNPCLIGWAVAIAAHYSGGPLNLLQWEKREKAYVVIQSDILMWS